MVSVIKVLTDLTEWANRMGGWEAQCWRDAEKLLKETKELLATDKEIEVARDYYQTDDVEIDDFGVMTSPNDTGRWVSAWVWVSDEMLDEMTQT
jgi:hypothetical protein